MRLRTTLVGMLVVISLVLSGTIYAGFAMHRSDVIAQEHGEVRETASVVANRIDTRLETTTDAVDLWTANAGLLEDNATIRSKTLGTFVERTSFSTAGLYAPNGTLLDIVGEGLSPGDVQLLVGTDYSADPFMEQALAGETYISEPTQPGADRYVVRVAAPVSGPNGSVRGVLSGNFDLAERELFRGDTAIGGDADHVTVTADGRELFAEPGIDGEPIVANATVDRTGWRVTVERSRSEIAGQLGVATAMQVGGVLVGLVAVGLLGVWVSRTTLVHIRTLLAALADLESGIYRTDVDLGSVDEWQRISDRFNSLARTLEQRDSQLRVLNRVLRHNLRNDMNVITARAERVLADEETPERVRTDVETIHETASRLINTSEHARTLYDDLLTSPKQAIEPIDVVDVVADRQATLAPLYPAATIETDTPASAWALDSAVLPIVVEELMRNALVHNDRPEAERQVTVTVEAGRDPVGGVDAARETRIVIADNGPGIPMVEEALLTDQLEETSVEHGSGLGVWLVNWLVDQIGGTVSVSTGVDRGTTVTVHLPAPAEPPDGAATDGET